MQPTDTSEAKIYRMTPEARAYHRERRAAIKNGTWVGRATRATPVDTSPCTTEAPTAPPDAA